MKPLCQKLQQALLPTPSTLLGCGQCAGSKRPHLQHVVDDVELDDRLPSYQVVHHGVVDIVHHKIAHYQDDTLQNVTHLRRLKQTSVPETYK